MKCRLILVAFFYKETIIHIIAQLRELGFSVIKVLSLCNTTFIIPNSMCDDDVC